MSDWNEAASFAILMGLALKSTAVLGVAWLAVVILRGQSAAARHLVWTAAAAALLALPVLSVSLPALPIPGEKALAYEGGVRFRTTSASGPDAAAALRPALPVNARPTPPHAAPWLRSHWRVSIMLLWAAGSLAAFSQMLIALTRLHAVCRRAASSPYRADAAELSGALGLRHPVDVRESPAGTMPMTFGILHPAVFLPRDASGWSDERRRVVLLHELAHVRRGDVPAQLMTRVALILHWWNPLAWIAWRGFLAERERATDDLVLRAGARASDYAGHLLDIARATQSGPALGWAAVAMARRSQLEGRLCAILDSRVNRKPAGRASAFAAVLAAIALIAPLAALHAQQDSTTALPADVDATIRAAFSQKNSELLEKPAAAFADLQQFDTARKLLDSALAIHEQVSGAQSEDYGLGLLRIGDLERRRGRASEAESFYTKAVGILGDRAETAPALLYLGILALRDKSSDVATVDFQKAETLDPSLAGPARMWTALASERAGKVADAEAMYRSALAVEASGSADAANTSALLARFLIEHGRAEEGNTLTGRANAIRSALYEKNAPKPDPHALHANIDGVTPPKVLSKVDPAYAVEAKAVRDNGSVLVRLEVAPDGSPQNLHVVKGLGFGLDEAAVNAIRQWRFRPGTKDGAPVTIMATIEVNFRLL